jgi:hypothetical protein
VFTHRSATEADDLTGLWPETQPHALNRDHVLLITDEAGQILGGAILFHSGHTVAMVGAVRIRPDLDHPQWIARALWRWVKQWCADHGVTMIGHAAGTEACAEAMTRLGGTEVGVKTMFEVPVT